jgi:hypothetical protein
MSRWSCRWLYNCGRVHADGFDRLCVVQQPRRARMCGFGDKVCFLLVRLWMLGMLSLGSVVDECRIDVRLHLHRVSDSSSQI